MLLIWQTGKSLPGRTYFQSSPFKSSGVRAGEQEQTGCRKGCVSSRCSCRCCWLWHLNVRIAPVLSGRIRAAMWKTVSIDFNSSQGRREPLCWCQGDTPRHVQTCPDTSQPTRGQPRYSSGRALWGQGPSTTTGRRAQGLETLTLRALPRAFSGKQNKAPKPAPSHVRLCSVARDEEGECHFWNAERVSF